MATEPDQYGEECPDVRHHLQELSHSASSAQCLPTSHTLLWIQPLGTKLIEHHYVQANASAK
jgi:hypothetical protein